MQLPSSQRDGLMPQPLGPVLRVRFLARWRHRHQATTEAKTYQPGMESTRLATKLRERFHHDQRA